MIHLIFALFVAQSFAKDFQTNAVNFKNAPAWLKRTRVEKITDKIQTRLEWTIRRVPIKYHSDTSSFAKAHKFGPIAVAVTQVKNGKAEIHLGPTINTDNFDQIFAHELVHVILQQKYKNAIPKWLEEGLANHLAQKNGVDYKLLAKNLKGLNVYELGHPFGQNFKATNENVRLRYMASQALAEMLDKKCDLENLIRLSVERKMEDYIKTYCEITDLNKAFRTWITGNSKP